jgi:fibronectin-binding autotransporter adhesin
MITNPMKRRSTVLLVAGLLCLGAWQAQAQLTINYDFTPNVTVPDNGQLTQTKTLGGLSGLSTFTGVDVRLNLTTANAGDPMFLGDMYSTLTFGSVVAGETTRTAVLLNRPGRDNTNAFGSSLSSLNVTLDDSAVHTNIWGTTSTTGTYNSDGRLGVDPHAVNGVAFSNGDRNNTLTSLNGAQLPSNRVVLLVSDTDPGGTATLSSWGLSVTGTAASSGTFTPGAGATLSDPGSSSVNNVGATLNVTGADGGSLLMNFAGTTTFSGGITGTAGITKTGAGTLILSAAGTYTGNTTVNAGTLLVSNSTGSATGTGNVTVNGAGTLLGGTGIITGTVTLGNVTPGAIINPGPVGTNGTASSVGTLTIGALTLTGANTLHIDASGTLAANWDKLVANGATLGSTSTLQLSIANSLTFAWGSQYTLIDNTSLSAISGTFSGIAEGGTYTFNGYEFLATYAGGDGNDLVFTAVPEPATWIGAALALGAIGFTQWRRLQGRPRLS